MTGRLLATLLVPLLGAAVLAAGSAPEREPNDDPAAPGYAGDIGALTRKPLSVEGKIAAYGEEGDTDRYRFALKEPKTISAALSGFAGDPILFLADAEGVRRGIPSAPEGHRLVTGAVLPAGTYFAVVAGETGPDEDPYDLVIWENVFRILRAKVKFNAKKPALDTAKLKIRFQAPLMDPARDGVALRFLDRDYVIPGAAFTLKGEKYTFRGDAADVLKKLVLDLAKGRGQLSLKGELGDVRPSPTLLLRMASGDLVSLFALVSGNSRKGGRIITYKAR